MSIIASFVQRQRNRASRNRTIRSSSHAIFSHQSNFHKNFCRHLAHQHARLGGLLRHFRSQHTVFVGSVSCLYRCRRTRNRHHCDRLSCRTIFHGQHCPLGRLSACAFLWCRAVPIDKRSLLFCRHACVNFPGAFCLRRSRRHRRHSHRHDRGGCCSFPVSWPRDCVFLHEHGFGTVLRSVHRHRSC